MNPVLNDSIPRISINLQDFNFDSDFGTRALQLLYNNREYYKLTPNNTFQVVSINESAVSTHVFINQVFMGVKIANAKGVVSFDNQGDVSIVSLDIPAQDPDLSSITPLISEQLGKDSILNYFRNQNITFFNEDPELIIYYTIDYGYRLLFYFLFNESDFGTTFGAYVDAKSGEVLEVVNCCFFAGASTGKVFNPDPGTYFKNYELPDSNDQNYYPISEAYSVEELKGLIQSHDGQWMLYGEYAQSVNYDNDSIPLASEPLPNFIYTRENQYFEEVNAYFHLDKQIRYIRSLGFIPKWNGTFSTNEQAIAFDASFKISEGAFYNSACKMINLGSSQNRIDYGEDISIIGHELGHAFHDSFISGGKEFYSNDYSDIEGISEGIAEYFGISYRRQKSFYRPNARAN